MQDDTLHNHAINILRLPQVAETVGLAVPTIRNKVRQGTFPLPLKIGERAVGWRSDDIQKWLEARPRAEYVPLPDSSE